jgi:hypothetical protein
MRSGRQHREGRIGMVSLVNNESRHYFDCYWYTGAQEDHLVEQATCPDAEAATRWGRERSAQVRIRDHGQSAWVGSGSERDGVDPEWSAATQRNVGLVPKLSRGRRDFRR